MARMDPHRGRCHLGGPARLIGDPGALAAVVAIIALWVIGSVIAGEPDLDRIPEPTLPTVVYSHP